MHRGLGLTRPLLWSSAADTPNSSMHRGLGLQVTKLQGNVPVNCSGERLTFSPLGQNARASQQRQLSPYRELMGTVKRSAQQVVWELPDHRWLNVLCLAHLANRSAGDCRLCWPLCL